jgi:hypothetical protein
MISGCRAGLIACCCAGLIARRFAGLIDEYESQACMRAWQTTLRLGSYGAPAASIAHNGWSVLRHVPYRSIFFCCFGELLRVNTICGARLATIASVASFCGESLETQLSISASKAWYTVRPVTAGEAMQRFGSEREPCESTCAEGPRHQA